MTWSPPPSPGPGNAPSRPSGHAAARTGPSGHWPPRPGSGPHAPGPPRSPPGDGPSSAIREYWSRCGSPRRGDESEQKTGSPNSPGMIDDFRLWGVKQMPSDGPPPFRRGGGGGLTWRRSCYAQRLSLRGQSPRRCGTGLSRNTASDAGQQEFPSSATEKRSEAAPRVSPARLA